MRASKSIVPFIACLLWIAPSFTVAADAAPAPERRPAPYFVVPGGDPALDDLPLKRTDVRIEIAGVIAEVTLRQTWANEGLRPIDASYVFPASTRAAVHGLRMTIDERVIEARIRERQRARAEFDVARREGKSASLLEAQRPNVFTMNVANVLPGDRIEVELRYTELLVPTDGVYELVFPTVVGPRYTGNAEGGDHDRWLPAPSLCQGAPPPAPLSLSCHVSAGMPLHELSSPTHPIVVDWHGTSEASVHLDAGEERAGDRDFVLRYRLAGGAIEHGLLVHRGERENFFLLMLEPPARVAQEDIPPREYVFIVDVSGSMSGYPLDTAKTLLRDLVGALRPQDRFNVMLFSGTQALLAPNSIPASADNVAAALLAIDRQRGGGGTELQAALERAMALDHAPGVSRSFIVVTDGYIASETSVFRYVRENVGRANVFAFGIGSSVNRFLIEGIARAGMGEPFVVTDPDETPAVAERFRRYLQFPVLTGVEIDWGGLDVYDVEPQDLPDLLAERPLIVHGKWRGPLAGGPSVHGTTGRGAYHESLDLSGAGETPGSNLPYLWARTRIAELSDRAFGAETEQQKAEIVRLGLDYNLLTRHTSFIAVHDVVRNPDGTSRNVRQPSPMPAGVSDAAVGSIGVGPEPEAGLLLLLVAAGIAGSWLLRRLR